jgi:transcription-repair coupling factor (superfamily II helicase)
MQLVGLTRFISHLDPVAGLRGRAGRTRVYGLLAAARPAVTAALVEGPAIIVVAHPQAAQDLAADLRVWTDHDVELFPAHEALPYERVRVDRAVLTQRETVAQRLSAGEPIVAVSSVRALMQPVAYAGSHRDPLVFRAQDTINLPETVADLVDCGYAESSLVEEQGVFARRGGVLDVFPAGATLPVRIELFGNEVESLRAFDPITQRSREALSEVTVPPIVAVGDSARLDALSALLEVDTSGLNAEAQTRWLDDLSMLEAGAAPEELPVFAPYLLGGSSLLEQSSGTAAVLMDDPDQIREVMEDLWEQAAEVQRDLEESGSLPVGMRPALFAPEAIENGVASRRGVDWYPGSVGDEQGEDWSGLFAPAPLFGGRVRSFVRNASENPGRKVIVASSQAARIEELLHEDDVHGRLLEALDCDPQRGIAILPVSLAEGWWLPAAHTMLLTDHEIFGRSRPRSAPGRRAARSAFFADYSPGDYVVHLEHGIGRFEGVTRMSIEGADREFALVQYAGSDRVYVPTDQLERLTRYIGVGDTAPQLSKLGGGEWQRARQRAKKAAEDIAHELIDLYSKRMARPGHGFGLDTPWQHELESSFPYEETPDQARAIEEVKADMEEARPMDRLVCADVGYGKTEVAVRAAFKAVMDGRQVAVLVPTTVLAQQHFETFSERLAPFPVRVEALSRFRSPAEQRDILRRLGSGEVDVVIGTHRLLQKDVHFKNLGMLIIDEEQRFGVKHKERLKQLRETIDVLTLTATPIPRTLHMTLVGIREVSVIETAPEGRLPIKTYLQPYDDRVLRDAIVREMERDGQVYIVHNKVATIEAMAERIRRLVPDARVLVGHGQMDESQLERVMLSFAHHQSDVLVSSTIIENGLDIPNVNTIVVNNAHTLGLTQLYQLRGRVGRGVNQAYAYLLYPRDAQLSHDAARRLEAVFEAQDLGAGFNIAMKDLEIRGAGNLLGAQQSGQAAAIGFDLYTRMVSEAVERLRGLPVHEPAPVTVDLPLTMFLPSEYIANESGRLTLYRRLASAASKEDLDEVVSEMRDRFGRFPVEVENLIASVGVKLAAADAHVNTVRLSSEALVMKVDPTGLFDRVSLYRRYGSDARIYSNMLRLPRARLGPDWLAEIRQILDDMIDLRRTLEQRATAEPEPAGAGA